MSSQRLTRLRARCSVDAFWLALTAGLCALPILGDLLLSDRRRAFGYVAADAFYYLTVARNAVDHGVVSFDQEYGTNGFHPLWQLVGVALFAMARMLGLEDHHVVTLSVVVGALAISAGVVLIGAALRRAYGYVSPLFVILPVGAYALLISPIWWGLGPEGRLRQSLVEGSLPLYGTLWSYANGMESALVILMFGVLAYWYVGKPITTSMRHAALFGVLLAVFAFARLDHALLSLIVLAVLVGRGLLERERRRLEPLLAMVAGFVIPLAVYLSYNELTQGGVVPVSGSLKTSLPFVANGNLKLWELTRDRIDAGKPWLWLVWRLAQLMIPLVLGTLYLVLALRLRRAGNGVLIELRSPGNRFVQFLWMVAAAVVGLGLYNLLFVYYRYQGHWYFPMSTLFVSLLVIRVLGPLRPLRWLQADRRGAAIWAAVWVALALTYFVQLQRVEPYHRRYAELYFDEGPRIRAHYGDQRPRLLSIDDGIVAFSTGFPTMSGLGLAGDAAVVEAAENGTIGDLAIERGYHHFTSLVYRDVARYDESTPSATLARFCRSQFMLSTAEKYRFSVDYRSEEPRFGIIKVEPR